MPDWSNHEFSTALHETSMILACDRLGELSVRYVAIRKSRILLAALFFPAEADLFQVAVLCCISSSPGSSLCNRIDFVRHISF